MVLESMNMYPENMVACGNNSYQYIMAGWECDGYPNCANGYDELNCQQNRSCHPEFYLCEEGYSCILDDFLCDDFLDCVNVSCPKVDNQFFNDSCCKKWPQWDDHIMFSRILKYCQESRFPGSNFFGKTPLFFRDSGVNAANAVNLQAKRR